jgi:hypothetical protein
VLSKQSVIGNELSTVLKKLIVAQLAKNSLPYMEAEDLLVIVTGESIASQQLCEPVTATTRVICVTTGKLNSSARCSLDGTRRTALRGLVVDCRPVCK